MEEQELFSRIWSRRGSGAEEKGTGLVEGRSLSTVGTDIKLVVKRGTNKKLCMFICWQEQKQILAYWGME